MREEGETEETQQWRRNRCIFWILAWFGPLQSTEEYSCVCLCVWMLDRGLVCSSGKAELELSVLTKVKLISVNQGYITTLKANSGTGLGHFLIPNPINQRVIITQWGAMVKNYINFYSLAP